MNKSEPIVSDIIHHRIIRSLMSCFYLNFRVRPLDLCQLDYLVGVDFSFAHGGTDEALLGRLLIWAVLISALLLKACSDRQRVLLC
jgi:hypothetical protein